MRTAQRRRVSSPGLPVSLTPRGWGCVAAAAALAASWWLIGLRDVWLFAWAFAALPAVSALIAVGAAVLGQWEVRVRVDSTTPLAGTLVHATAIVRHRFPGAHAGEIRWLLGDAARATPFDAAPGGGNATVAWTATVRGAQRVTVSRVSVTDPLGLARCRAPGARATADLLVLPRPLAGLAVHLDGGRSSRAGADAGRIASGVDDGASGGASLREYRPGDAPRQVNWKQSARQGELLVNLPEHAQRTERAVVLDGTREAYRSDEEFELAVAATAAIVVSRARSGELVDLRAGSGASVVSASEDTLLRALAEARRSPASEAAPAASSARPMGTEMTAELPGTVVTGEPQAALRLALAATSSGGTLYTTRVAMGRSPGAWHVIAIPEAA